MTPARAVAAGLALFIVFAVIFAPASLLRTLLPAEAGIDLLSTRGTLWNGSGALYLAGQPAGTVRWHALPVTILTGSLSYDVAVAGPEHDLSGRVAAGWSAGTLELNGRAAAAFVNRWLAPYDIAMTGDLTFEDVTVQLPYDAAALAAGSAAGQVTWAGGPVRYRLAGRNYAGELPPLVAYLGDGLEAEVYPKDGQTPLLRADIRPNGFIRIAVTQLLTRLVGNPWPGSHADHEVVLEVEEQLF